MEFVDLKTQYAVRLIALMALGEKNGDEVVTTPFTFAATAEMIVLIGATPVFVDVEEDTANIDVSRLGAAITPRTRAIMPVSLYGQPADMDETNAIAAQGGPKSSLYNIGHGSPVKLMDFVHAVGHALGKTAQIELAPMQQGGVRATYASTEKLRAENSYALATSIETGVGRFLASYGARYAGCVGRAS